MALVTCTECGNKHSENAEICPSCGNPNPLKVAQRSIRNFSLFSFPFFLTWFGTSGYLLYKNWLILEHCNPDKYKNMGTDVLVNYAVLVFGSIFAPIFQFFNYTEIWPFCGRLFDQSLIYISRIALASGLMVLLLSWIVEKKGWAKD